MMHLTWTAHGMPSPCWVLSWVGEKQWGGHPCCPVGCHHHPTALTLLLVGCPIADQLGICWLLPSLQLVLCRI